MDYYKSKYTTMPDNAYFDRRMSNGDKLTDIEKVLSKKDAIEGKYIILRRGKKKYFLIECK